jgi:hypothetical protein
MVWMTFAKRLAVGYMDSDLDTEDTQSVEVDPTIASDATSDAVDQGDGTTLVAMDSDAAPSQGSGDFYDNLAETIGDDELSRLAEKYLNLIDQDIESRNERDKQYTDGLKRTGIAEPAPGGASFEGASKATHPVLAEAYIDFSASAIKELFPPNGPVRTKIDGKPNHEKTERAERKAAFMNWQLTNEIRGYRSELERLLTQLPAGGTQFMKFYWSEDLGRIDVEFVPIDNFILPYNAKNFYDCQRKFHRMEVSPLVVDRKVDSGVWRDWSLPPASGANFSESETSKHNAKIEGKSESGYQDDADRNIYEGCVFEQLEGDDKPVPYLITIDEETRNVLALYRNWDEDDSKCTELDWVVDYNFIPWRGAYGIGLPQIIGGLSDAATGSLRALLDSALISNSATALKLKGGPSGSNNSIEITQATEIDANGQDDIRKIAMPLPFPGPSPVLFQLLGFVTQAAKGVVGTAEEKIADASNNMPVGTALALIEQGAKVFSAIHARQHDSQRRGLEIIHRLNRDHLPDRVQFGSDPDDYVTRQDFEGVMDVHPVSDPNIFSETQRFAQTQAIIQIVTQLGALGPQLAAVTQATGIQLHALIKKSLEQMKYPYIDEVLPDIPTAKPSNPCDENVDLSTGKPVKAFPGQDHQAHIQVHLDFAQSPFFGLSVAMDPKFQTNCLNHVQDHLLNYYQELMMQDAGVPDSAAQAMADNSPQIAEALAKSSATVQKAMEIAFEKIPALMQQAKQHIIQNAPKPPPDPMVAVAQQKTQGDMQIAQGKLSLAQKQHVDDMQLKAQELQQDATKAQQEYALEMKKLGFEQQTEVQTTDMKARADLEKAAGDNRTAVDIAGMKIASDLHTHLMDGGSLSGSPKAGE